MCSANVRRCGRLLCIVQICDTSISRHHVKGQLFLTSNKLPYLCYPMFGDVFGTLDSVVFSCNLISSSGVPPTGLCSTVPNNLADDINDFATWRFLMCFSWLRSIHYTNVSPVTSYLCCLVNLIIMFSEWHSMNKDGVVDPVLVQSSFVRLNADDPKRSALSELYFPWNHLGKVFCLQNVSIGYIIRNIIDRSLFSSNWNGFIKNIWIPFLCGLGSHVRHCVHGFESF